MIFWKSVIVSPPWLFGGKSRRVGSTRRVGAQELCAHTGNRVKGRFVLTLVADGNSAGLRADNFHGPFARGPPT